MINVYLHGPQWFLGVDAALEALAAVIALLVALVAHKAYRLTGEKKYFYFTGSIYLLTLSFLSRAVTDAVVRQIFFEIPDSIAGIVFYLGYVVHILLAFVAYIILIAITHKIYDKRVLALLFLTLIPSLLLSGSYYRTFYGLSLIFLAFITLAYYQNYRKVNNLASFTVFVAFALLTLAQLQFLLQGFYIWSANIWNTFYVTSHVTQALGYLSLFIALLKAKRSLHETRKNRHNL